jgi:hypothetical protein
MSRVLRKLDRRLRFCGWGLEQLFTARNPEGAGGHTAAGRPRAPPERVYKLKQLGGGFKLFCSGKHKKKVARPARAPFWATFYCTLEPCAPPPQPPRPPPLAPPLAVGRDARRATSAGLAAAKAAKAMQAARQGAAVSATLERDPLASRQEATGGSVLSRTRAFSTMALDVALAFASPAGHSAAADGGDLAPAANGAARGASAKGFGSEGDAEDGAEEGLIDPLIDSEALSDDEDEEDDLSLGGSADGSFLADGGDGDGAAAGGARVGTAHHHHHSATSLRSLARASEQLDDGNGGFVLKFHPGGHADEVKVKRATTTTATTTKITKQQQQQQQQPRETDARDNSIEHNRGKAEGNGRTSRLLPGALRLFRRRRRQRCVRGHL